MNPSQYLSRIQYNGIVTPTLEVLKNLHHHHLMNIPFENLDIHFGNPISLDFAKIYNKLIVRKRGGFCYELNGLFWSLLSELGFKVKMVSARVYDSMKNEYGREFDHLAIIAEIDQKEFLVDVGFGEFIFEPLELEINKIQKDKRGIFIIEAIENRYFRVSKLIENEKHFEYIFSKNERRFEEFKAMCNYHQTSPESHFTQKRLVSKPTQNGRVTITGNTLKITEEDLAIHKTQFETESEFGHLLLMYFEIIASPVSSHER